MLDKENMIKEFIKEIYSCDLKNLTNDELYHDVKSNIISKYKEFIISSGLREMLYKYAEQKVYQLEKEDKSLRELFPNGYENSLKVFVYNKGPEITSALKEFINGEKFKSKIREEVGMFLSGINPMVSKFTSPESINTKLVNSISAYIDSPEAMFSIITAINNGIDEGSGKSITEITNYLPYEGKVSWIKAAVDTIVNMIIEDLFILQFTERIEEEILKNKTLGKLLNSIGISEDILMNRIIKIKGL